MGQPYLKFTFTAKSNAFITHGGRENSPLSDGTRFPQILPINMETSLDALPSTASSLLHERATHVLLSQPWHAGWRQPQRESGKIDAVAGTSGGLKYDSLRTPSTHTCTADPA